MKIYLIRHGETTGDLENRYGGDYDDHLSLNGIKQAENLGNKLKSKKLQMIYHSPKIRAKETAQIVLKVANIPLKEIEGIRERNNYGVLTGMIKSEAHYRFPSEVEKLKQKKFLHKIKNSENYDTFKKRIITSFERILFQAKENDFRSLAIITHGGPIACLFREYLQLGEFKRLGDCAIIELEYKKNKLKLISLDGAELNYKSL